MDSWATDGFYSHFPSYSQQPTRREALAKARQHDYQTYLSRVSPKKDKPDGKAQKRHTVNNTPGKRQKIPTMIHTPNDDLPKIDTNTECDIESRVSNRNRFVDELEKMDLPDIFNEEMINERSQKLAEEKRLRNVKYQQELMAQIEQKRREREVQKAKEQKEEERLMRKMEEQLKLVRLQDEIESQRQIRHREHRLINLDLSKPITNSQPIKPPNTVRSDQLESNVYTFRSYDERKAQSDRGKENWEATKRNDKDIYNFFTNSAHNHSNKLKDIRYSHYFDLEDVSESEALPNSMSSSTYNTYPSKSTRHQHEPKQPLCNFCKHNGHLTRNQQENIGNSYFCGSCEKEPICLNCRKEICIQCKRPTHNNKTNVKASPGQLKQRNFATDLKVPKNRIGLELNPTQVRTESFQQIQTDEDESLSDLSSTDHKPYSFNIDESSVFHPSKSRLNRRLSVNIRNGEVFIQPDSFDELKRITEEKLIKLSKSYGEIQTKKFESEETNVQEPTLEQQPVAIGSISTSDSRPILRENTKKLIEFAKELERGDSNIFRRIEAKHQLPSVQRKKIVENSDRNTSTLTQLGAFKKQLQLDKLNF